MTKIKTVGYRFGKAPESGLSYNYAENRNEDGLSMASVAHTAECRSFATMEAKEKRRKYFYEGEICGTGGDDEYLLTNIKQITAKEYKAAKNKEVTNLIVNEKLSRLERLHKIKLNEIACSRYYWRPGSKEAACQEATEKYSKEVAYWL